MAPLLSLQTGSTNSIQLQPIVALSILDHHLRRPEHQDRAVGILLGTKNDSSSSVQITNACPLVYNIDRAAVVDMEHFKTTIELHGSLARMVGWYATSKVDSVSASINEFFARETGIWPLVHLSIVPSVLDGVSINAYTDAPIGNDVRLGTIFHCVPHSFVYTEQELVSLSKLKNGGGDIKGNTETVKESADKLRKTVDAALEYVDKIVNGSIEGDVKIFRKLEAALDGIPFVSKDKFESEIAAQLGDISIASSISNITKSQVLASSRLQLSGKK